MVRLGGVALSGLLQAIIDWFHFLHNSVQALPASQELTGGAKDQKKDSIPKLKFLTGCRPFVVLAAKSM